jgi:lipopolysaccharide export system permease protein
MVLIAIIWLMQSLRLIDLITNKGVEFFSFLKITTMLITPLSYVIIPVALLMAVVMFINRMSHDRELVILRGAGLSNYQIAKPMIYYAVIITIFNYAISFYFLPKSYREFKDMQELFRNKYLSLFLENSVFNTQINNLTVYVDSKNDDTNFEGIFIYDQRDPNSRVTIMADSGSVTRTKSGPEFLLVNGSHQDENVKTGAISLVFFDTYRFNLSLFTDVSMNRYHDANEMYINQLLFPKNMSPEESKLFFVHGNQRAIWPMYTLILTLLSSGFMLSGYYSRRHGIFKTLFTAVCCGAVVVLSLSFNNLALRNVNLVPLMYLNAIFFLMFGVKMLSKHHTLSLFNKFEMYIRSLFMQKGLK